MRCTWYCFIGAQSEKQSFKIDCGIKFYIVCIIDCGVYLFMDEKAIPLEKKCVTVINSVTGKEEKLPALVSKIITRKR